MRELVGPYRILEALGRGGMGVVYRGVHDTLERPVAVKALAPELTQHPQFRERFFSEARTQAHLHHPNIVTVYDLIEDGGEYFIVMEYVSGQGLDERLTHAGQGGLPMEEALGIFSQILSALDYAHSEGVIHRDIKPSNVVVNERGQVKLMDFGIALLIGDKRLTMSSQTIGTPAYMSPEQILRPLQVDHRTDIYSSAVLLFEMLTGKLPFDAESEYEIKKQHIETPPPDVSELVGGVSREIATALGIALSKDPESRFASAAGFARALTGAAPAGSSLDATTPLPRTAASQANPPPLPADGSRPGAPARSVAARSKTPWLIAGAAALALALLGAGFLILRPAPVKPTAGSGAATSPEAPAPDALTDLRQRGEAQPSALAGPTPAPPLSSEAAGSEREAQDPSPGTAPPPPPPPPPPRVNAEEEIRKRTVAQLRPRLREGIAGVERNMKAGRFADAQTRTRELLAMAAPHRAEFVDEIVRLNVLDSEITNAIVSQRTQEQERRVQRSAWERRVQEIRDLIAERKYPEAKNLAQKLSEEAELPEDLRAQARQLREQAEQEMKNAWGDAEWGPASNEIQKKGKQ